MKVCIDVQSAVTQRAGVGRYTRTLAEHLGALTRPSDDLLLFYFDFKRAARPFAVARGSERVVRWCPGRLAQWAWKTLRWPPFDALCGAADLYHFPNFVLPPLRRGRSVVTIHDVSFLRYPQFAEEKNLRHLRAHMRETIRRADAILTVSAFSAGEITELFDVEPARVHAVHNGIAAHFRPAAPAPVRTVRERHGLRKPYLLTVGTLEPRKNLPFLVDLFEALERPDLDLVIAGMAGWKVSGILQRLHESRRAEDIRWIEYVGDDELPALYSGAEAFVCTSVYEGFGFPPLEAMACGTPVLSSSGGSLAEVLDDAAVVRHDFELAAWRDSLLGLLDDTAGRASLRAAGRARASRFTWENAARQIWDVYRRVAG